MPEQSMFDVKIPKSQLPALIAAIVGIGGGGIGGQFLDLTGAKAWKEANQKAIAQAEKNEELIVALRAQNAQLLTLVTDDVCSR